VSPLPPPGTAGVRRFAPRPVALEKLPELARDTAALLGAAPLRLCGLFLLVFMAVQLMPSIPYLSMPLRSVIATVGFSGFFIALEAVRQGQPPTILDMAQAWRLPPDKLVLLVVSGLVPLFLVLLVWWSDIGGQAVAAVLAGNPAPGVPGERQQLEFIVIYNLVDIPLLFLQPLCVLFPWTASRTLSANLLAVLANWRWALLLGLISIPVAILLESFDPNSTVEVLLALGGEVLVEILLCAFTLVLLHRSLRPSLE